MKPYGYVRKDGEGLFIYGEHQFQNAMGAELVPVYLHPKEWVGLTDEEIDLLEELYAPPVHPDFVNDVDHCFSLIKQVEAKLKEKNHG